MVLAHSLDGHGIERVLVLHDWLSDSTEYDPAIPYFDLTALTLARVDLPGYGASRAIPVRGVDAATLDRDVLAVADHLQWARFHLVAHSMSTVVAQRLARSAVERLASVTLVTPVPPGLLYPDPVVDSLRAVGRHPDRRHEAFAPRWGTRLSARWLEWKLEQWAARSDAEAVAAYVDLFARSDLATTRAAVDVPVLAITGAEDAPHFARMAVEPAIRAVYPDTVVEEISAAGHYPMQEAPPLFASLVERFVRAHPLATARDSTSIR
jgi:pimeloyl-ACP methyl ester carboxylesterase